MIFARFLADSMQLEGTRPITSSFAAIVAKTILQTVLVWGVFLWLIPMLLIRVEMAASISTFSSNRWSEWGLLIFMVSSTLFLLSAWSIVWQGHGTPWPWDRSTHLVVAGPYRYVRNPMVIAGIGQGIASALILGSYLGFAYLVVGVALWNFVLRPMEEGDLAHRFGKPYVEYFQSVSAWIPRLKPHRTMIVASLEEVSALEND